MSVLQCFQTAALTPSSRAADWMIPSEKLFLNSVAPVVGVALSQVQRRCPWERAIIASPCIRLRYGLPLCCMLGEPWISRAISKAARGGK
jgi:hypothetical protein